MDIVIGICLAAGCIGAATAALALALTFPRRKPYPIHPDEAALRARQAIRQSYPLYQGLRETNTPRPDVPKPKASKRSHHSRVRKGH